MYKAHLTVGGVFLILFLLTGGYMFVSFPDLYADREEVRMMYRATHVYILFASLLNLMTANYVKYVPLKRGWSIKTLASCLILTSPAVLVMAFVLEPASYLIERPLSFWAVIALFVGVLLHSVVAINWRR